jgi:type IV pilus assembly protein PilC
MPSYFYKATSNTGEEISGTETATSEREVARILRNKGYIITSVSSERKGEKNTLSIGNMLGRIRGVPLKEKVVFTRNLKVMIASGVPLPRALDAMAQQAQNKKFKEALVYIREEVVKGQSLSASMKPHPKVFSELFQNMIKAGEESGTMEEVLEQLSIQMERDYEVRSKIKGALTYPGVIVFAMIIIGIFMLTFVVPKLAETFEDLEVELPITTQAVIQLGNFFSERWYLVVAGLVLFGFGFMRAIKTAQGKRIFDRFVLKSPILSGIIIKMQVALTARTLSSLLKAGVPIVQALEITSRVLGNSYFREAMHVSSEQVQKGSKFSAVLSQYKHLYPVMVVQMVEVGEETGETTEILEKMAEFFEDEVNQVTKNLTSIIEPVLMLVIGAVVGLFAVSMFQPMYSLLGSIQ